MRLIYFVPSKILFEMHTVATVQQEQAEVEFLLQSCVFEKAPRLGRFFRYICERHFEGRADCLKEYSIALEALGRSSDFDPKKDSIVRVEAHRLRKRLEEFYRGPGANHEVHVVIPNGQYRPQFVVATSLSEQLLPAEQPHPAATTELVRSAEISPLLGYREEAQSRRNYWPILVGIAVACAMMLLLFVKTSGRRANAQAVPPLIDEVWNGKPIDTAGADVRLLAGYHGAPYIDRQSHIWQPDAFYRGGTSHSIPADHFIEAQPDPHLLRSIRSGKFEYAIPLRQGSYELHLLFTETEFGRGNKEGTGEGSRTFSVAINGQNRLVQFDPLAEAGAPNRLDERVFSDIAPGSDGKLHLSFDGGSGSAVLSAIEILPSAPGRIHPVRMVTQANPVTDADGRVWAADEYVIGGTTVFRENILFDPKEKALYQGERYGNFTYRIPLAPGKYRVTLHFAEQWFGTAASQMADIGNRHFDVYANGVALLRDFVVGTEAGGPNRCVNKSFEHMQPNAQGTLVLEFVPVKNYAELNAIEVVQTQ